MKPVEIVMVEKLIPIFKDGTEANAIQVARVKEIDGESCEFNIVVGKGLYEVGEKVVYIQPDYCVPDNDSFSEYWRPGGDEKKSRLGKKGRLRALKFNFQFEGKTDPIYSNGIIIPVHIVMTEEVVAESVRLELENQEFELQTLLGVTKYVADDSIEGSQNAGLNQGDFPHFMYKTDEPRIENLKSHVNKCYNEGIVLSGTLKRDGSSISLYCRRNPISTEELSYGVCTRNQEKKLDQLVVTGYIGEGGVHLRQHFDKEKFTKGWMNDVTGEFFTTQEAQEKFLSIETEVCDSWVDTVKKHGYLDKLIEYCTLHDMQLALRGELIGAGNKGSGNKLNEDAKNSESKVVWFGIDDLSSGHSERIDYSSPYNLKNFCEACELEYTTEIFEGVFNYDMLIEKCEHDFNVIKEKTGQIVEGIVIRSKYSNSMSVKYINNEYDSKS